MTREPGREAETHLLCKFWEGNPEASRESRGQAQEVVLKAWKEQMAQHVVSELWAMHQVFPDHPGE